MSFQLTTVLNPNCPDDLCTIANGPAHDDQPAIITVVHVRADGPNDTIHHIWDFTGRPSVLIARTALNATLAIDWPAFMRNESRSVRFEPAPLYSSCLVLTRLLAYNDATDVGHLLDNATEATDQQPPIDAFDTRDFRWLRQHFENADELAHVDVVGTNAGSFGANGAVRLTMKAFGRRQYDLASPHLLHSENGTQVAMMLDQLNVTDAKTDGARRRFALEWFHVASEPPGAGEFSVQHRRVLDDEHTPGVFELRDIVSPGSMLYANGSYVHFRPVSYTSVVREMGASTAVHVQRPQNISDAEQRLADGGSMAWSFYGYALGGKELLVQAYNVSFGAAGDGFYARNNLNTW